MQNWKARTGLAKEVMRRHNVSDKWVTSYLNSHSETEFETQKWVSMDIYDGSGIKVIDYPVRSGMVLLPDIDKVFEEQNLK